MIVFPNKWETIGRKPNQNEIEGRLFMVLKDINCNNLSLSGGIDSSLMLYWLTRIYNPGDIHCYTIALNEQHPDFIFSKLITEEFGVNWYYLLTENKVEDEYDDLPGDAGVRKFFDWIVREYLVTRIICCDGIDEFMGGYYAHTYDPTHTTYYNFMSRLCDEQLIPLNKSSGGVEVLLPYLDEVLVSYYNRIPMVDRFDSITRKKVMRKLANGKIPEEIINRRKYGFVDIGIIKGEGK